jgi:transposase InsO family protein
MWDKIKGWRWLHMYSYSLLKYDTSKVAKKRLQVIKFFEKYGLQPTIDAFGVSKSSIYRWRKKLKDSEGELKSLVPKSTRPKKTRKPVYDKRIVAEIKRLRDDKYVPGKKKLKPMIDKYCKKKDIKTVSESTIGRILKRNNYFHNKQRQIRHSYHTATGKWKRKRKKKRKRVRYHPKPTENGYVQIDTVIKFVDGIKRYVICAIDVKMKFSFAYMYPKLNSSTAKDFFINLQKVYPLKIKVVQTDNGYEFLGDFDQYLEKEGIKHVFTYPRCPKINGTVERMNRTLQEKFIDPNLHLIHYPEEFNEKMVQYLLYYNTERPHESLGMKSPIDYLIDGGFISQMYRTCTAN